MKILKILISNAAGYGNVGDDAIRDVIIYNIKKNFPNSQIIFTHPPPQLDLVMNADVIIVGGGGLLYDSSIENVDNYMRYLEWGQELDKKTVCLGVGTQGIMKEYGNNRYREILNRCDLVTVRDHETADELKNIGIEKDIKVCADVAWLLKPKKSQYIIEKKDKPVLGIAIFGGKYSIFDPYNTSIEHLLSKYKDIFDYVFFIFSKDDIELTKRLQITFGGRIVEYENITPGEYLSLVKMLDIAVVNRFHPFIFSIMTNVPVCVGDLWRIGSYGNGKISRLAKLFEYKGLTNIHNIDPKILEDKFDWIYINRKDIVSNFDVIRNSMEEKANENFKYLKELLINMNSNQNNVKHTGISGFYFPYHDIMWKDTANFIKKYLKQNDIVAGPSEFNEIIGPLYTDILISYDNSELFVNTHKIELDWFILHKGRMNDIDNGLLIKLYRKYDPVFANEVFIIFTKSKKGIDKIDRDSDHYKSFIEKISEKESIKESKKEGKVNIFGKLKRSFGHKNILLNNIEKLQQKFLDIEKIITQIGDKNYREYIYLGDYKILTKTIFGHKIFLDTRDISIAPHIILDGYWEMWVTKVVMNLLKEDMNIIEIGANVGYYSLMFASKIGESGKLFVFEANPQIFDILIQSMEINGFSDRVNLENKAVTNKSGRISFNRLKRHHGSNSIIKFSDKRLEKLGEEMDTIEIDTVSLDEYFKDQNIKIDIIKIDAEGSEYLIFDGMKKLINDNPNIIIICEFSPSLIRGTEKDPRKFLEEIKQYGFPLKYIDERSNIIDGSIDELLKKGGCELYLKR